MHTSDARGAAQVTLHMTRHSQKDRVDPRTEEHGVEHTLARLSGAVANKNRG